MRVGDGDDLTARVEMLVETGDAGVSVGRDGRIVLVVILEGDDVFGRGVPVEIGNSLMSQEVSGSGNNCVLREAHGGSFAISGWDQILAVGEFVIEKSIGDRADVARIRADVGIGDQRGGEVTGNLLSGRIATRSAVEIVIHDRSEARRSPVVGEAGGNGEARKANLLVRGVIVLITHVAE